MRNELAILGMRWQAGLQHRVDSSKKNKRPTVGLLFFNNGYFGTVSKLLRC